MTEPSLKLSHAPIIEAVVDLDCDLPPLTEIQALEQAARERFQEDYPTVRMRHFLEHELEAVIGSGTRTTTRSSIQGYIFATEDGAQLVQVRDQGYSFNRLTPYTTLDDYLAEIRRTWLQFVQLAEPVQVRAVRLRYINRLLLPMTDGLVELHDYLRASPQLPGDDTLELTGFVEQYAAVEKHSGHEITVILTTQEAEQGKLPVILDITVASAAPADPDDWQVLASKIQSLRILKNQIFQGTLTPRCLQLFQ